MKTQYQNQNTLTFILLLFALLFFSACKEDPGKPNPAPADPNVPLSSFAKINTGIIKNITSESAEVDLEIIDNGGSTITESGVCWSRSNSNPTLKTAHKSVDGKPLGISTAKLTDLNPLDRYFVRAYATNSKGTAYGEVKQFRTEMGTVTDISGNTYHTLTIGKQVWMKENLKTVLFRDGQAIPLIEDRDNWRDSASPAYCWHDNDPTDKNEFGALYNGYAVESLNPLAPEGWEIPSAEAWGELINFVGGSPTAGGKLKTIHTWLVPNIGASNVYGFAALPAGFRDHYGYFGGFKEHTKFWSTTKVGDDIKAYNLSSSSEMVSTGGDELQTGASVRCVRQRPAKD